MTLNVVPSAVTIGQRRLGSDPNQGLVHYVESGQLIVPWKEHKAFLRDEERAERLREHNEHHGFQRDSPIVRALEQVFDEVGEPVMLLRGTLSGEPEVIEPSTVLVSVETTERAWEQKARRGDYIVSLLNEYRASWAILRQWAGHDVAISQREAQIQRLERLVWDAIYALQKAGLDGEAARLRRVLDKG